MNEELVPYLVGCGSGVLAFVGTSFVLAFPQSFALFLVRSLAIVIVGALGGFLLADRYLQRTDERDTAGD